jgi:hypothetical protein
MKILPGGRPDTGVPPAIDVSKLPTLHCPGCGCSEFLSDQIIQFRFDPLAQQAAPVPKGIRVRCAGCDAKVQDIRRLLRSDKVKAQKEGSNGESPDRGGSPAGGETPCG